MFKRFKALMLTAMSILLGIGGAKALSPITYQWGPNPIYLENLADGSEVQVVVTAGGTSGYTGFVNYSDGKVAITTNKVPGTTEDGAINENYVFTLCKVDGSYAIKYGDKYLQGSTAADAAALTFSDEKSTFTAASSGNGAIANVGGNAYTFTCSAEDGQPIKKSNGCLSAGNGNDGPLQFFEIKDYTGYELPRINWTIYACSERSGTTEGEDGTASMIIDDNLKTYWHNNWESAVCKTANHLNYFLIDCDDEVSFTAFKYVARNSGTNGVFTGYELYALDSPIECTDAAVQSVRNGNTPIAQASISTGSASTVLAATFSKVKARYLLMVGTSTVNGFGSCADFRIYGDKDDVFTSANNVKKSYLEKLDHISPIIPTDTWTALTDWSVEDAEYSTFTTALNNCYSSLNQQMVYINNDRRNGGKAYLVHKTDDKVNSSAYTCERAKWQLKQDASNPNYFSLYSPVTRGYLLSSLSVGSPSSSDEALKVTFTASGSDYRGTYLPILNSSAALNLDNAANNLTTYADAKDGGSSWTFSLVSSDPSDDKYYRIRNDRALTTTSNWQGIDCTSAGSLFAIEGITEASDINADIASMAFEGPSTVWKVEAVDEAAGRYRIRNFIADYAEGNFGLTIDTSVYNESSNYTKVTDTPTEFYLIPASEYGVTSLMRNGYAISSSNETYEESSITDDQRKTCIDLSASLETVNGKQYRYGLGNAWHPTGSSDQGSVFYFEEVSEEELNIVKAEYIQQLSASVVNKIDADKINTARNLHTYANVLYPDALDFQTDIEEEHTATLNSAIARYRELIGSEHVAELSDALTKFYAQPDDEEVQFHAKTDATYLGTDADGLAMSESMFNPSTIWVIEQVDVTDDTGCQYLLKDWDTDTYLATDGTLTDKDSADKFAFVWDGDENTENHIRITDGIRFVGIKDNKFAMYEDDAAESLLYVSQITFHSLAEPTVTGASKIVFDDVTYVNPNRGHRDITLTPYKRNVISAARRVVATASAGDTEGSYVLTVSDEGAFDDGIEIPISGDNAVAAGEYILTVPRGYFITDEGLLNEEFATYMVVKETGVLTELDEITADGNDAAHPVYDLQGRRVVNPQVANFYIVDGRITILR